MSDRIEKLRRGQAAKGLATLPARPADAPAPERPLETTQAVAEVKPTQKPKKDGKPGKDKPGKPLLVQKPPKEIIKYVCGHVDPVANIMGRPCPYCIRKNQVVGKQRRRDKNAARKGQQVDDRRLPEGAVYQKVYNAAAKEWSCTLTIPMADGSDPRVFEAKGSASFGTEIALDKMFWTWWRDTKHEAPIEG